MVICDECGGEFPADKAPLLDDVHVCRACVYEMIDREQMTAVEIPARLVHGMFGTMIAPAYWDYSWSSH